MRKISIVVKLWVVLVSFMALVLTALGWIIPDLFEVFYFNHQARELTDHGRTLAKGLRTINYSDYSTLREVLKQGSKLSYHQLGILNEKGQLVAFTDENHIPLKTKVEEAEIKDVWQGKTVVFKGLESFYDDLMYTAIVPVSRDGKVVAAVLVHTPLHSINETINKVKLLIMYSLTGAVIFTAIFALFLSKAVVRPLVHIRNVALAMAKGDFSQKVSLKHHNDELGQLAETINFVSTELNRSLARLASQRDNLYNVFNSMNEAIFVFDTLGYLQMYNSESLRFLPNIALGISVQQLDPRFQSYFKQVVDENKIIKKEITFQKRVLVSNFIPISIMGQELQNIILVLHDVTKERQIEQMRRHFVANVSHELNTPLMLIQGHAEAIREGIVKDKPQQNKSLDVILAESGRMHRLVRDLLDLAQLEAGQLTLHYAVFSIEELLMRVAKKFQLLSMTLEIDFKFEMEDCLPLVNSDADRWEQVLTNILDNAFRYAAKGNELKKVHIVAQQRDKDWLEITIKDSGPGIAPKDLPQIWERFYKVEKARTRNEGGTGLGLAIVRHLIDVLDSKIQVCSELGKGTTFIISLPTKLS